MNNILLAGGWIFIGVTALVMVVIMYKITRKKTLSKKERLYPLILLGAGFLYVIALAFTYAKPGISLSDQIQILIQFGLVTVTCFYAWSAQRQAEANVTMAAATTKQAEIALNGQFNAAAPLVDVEAWNYEFRDADTRINLVWRNIGTGPALNFRCWIEDEEYPQLRQIGKETYRAAIANDQDSYSWTVNVKIKGYRLGVGKGYLRAQYQSVFEIPYETAVIYETPDTRELKYGKATEIVPF